MSRASDFESAPSIGIVVPSLNQGRFLRETLESLFRQEYPALEVVVMDGGSTDESLEVIRSFEDRLTHWQSGPDRGQSDAVNQGVTQTTAQLVGWLNSDDFQLEDALWTVARAYERHPGFGFYFGNGFRYHEETGRYVPFCRHRVAFDREALVRGLDYVLQPSVFFSREAWEEVGGLDPELRYCMDWDVLIRIAKRYPVAAINEFLAVSREYSQTKTQSGGLERAFEIDAMLRSHTEGETTVGSLHYLLETLLGLPAEVAPAPLRHHVWEALRSLRPELLRIAGRDDGFPARTGAHDLSLAGRHYVRSFTRTYRELTRGHATDASPTAALTVIKSLLSSFATMNRMHGLGR